MNDSSIIPTSSHHEGSIKGIEGIVKVHEIIKDKFYFAIATNSGLEECLNLKKDNIIFYCAHNNLFYEPLIFDFGPYSLSYIWKYCMYVKKYLKLAHSLNKVLVHVTSFEEEKLVNSAFVCGAYAILCLDYEPEQIYNLLSDHNRTKFIGFRDASVAQSSYSLKLEDCFKALKKAIKLKFFDLATFNLQEYVYYEKVKNGDLNWIIPKKILAFSGPHNKTESVNDYPHFAPDFYFDYFRSNNVTTIIRLNEKRYDERKFTDHGFDHKDLIFRDGTTPSMQILEEFLKICEESKGAVAVHCKAGLGRTGTLIACYLIKHFKFTANEAIAWTRICRPGSVIACQQTFLVLNESYLLYKGEMFDLQRREDDSGVRNLNKMLEGDLKYTSSENELTNKLKKLASKLNKVNLQIDDQHDDSNENKIDTQGDILHKLKWTRSKSRLAQSNGDSRLCNQFESNNLTRKSSRNKNLDLVTCDEQTIEISKLSDNNKNSNLSIKKLIQHYNSKCSENERSHSHKKRSVFDDKSSSTHYRTRSFTSSLLNRSKIHGSDSITKPNQMAKNTLITSEKLMKETATNNLKINTKVNILPIDRTTQVSRSRLVKLSELK